MFAVSKLRSFVVLVAIVPIVPATAFADPPGQWVRETHRAYPDQDVAARVAAMINSGSVPNWRNATVSPQHPVTRDYVVTAEQFYPAAPAPQDVVVQGQLTRTDPMDRLRLNMHAKAYNVNFVAGRTYTVDLMSGDGRSGPHNPGFFDTWLRIEDAQGNIKEQNDDGGEGLNSRVTFTPTVSGNYIVVVTSYASNATGSFVLRVR